MFLVARECRRRFVCRSARGRSSVTAMPQAPPRVPLREAVGRSKINVIARRSALTLGYARQEYLPAMQRVAPRPGLVRTPQRAVRAPQLVVRCLRLWIRDGRSLSGITANRGLAPPKQTLKSFRQKSL